MKYPGKRKFKTFHQKFWIPNPTDNNNNKLKSKNTAAFRINYIGSVECKRRIHTAEIC